MAFVNFSIIYILFFNVYFTFLKRKNNIGKNIFDGIIFVAKDILEKNVSLKNNNIFFSYFIYIYLYL